MFLPKTKGFLLLFISLLRSWYSRCRLALANSNPQFCLYHKEHGRSIASRVRSVGKGIICGINSTPGTCGLNQPASNGLSEPLDARGRSKPTRAWLNLCIDVEMHVWQTSTTYGVPFTWPSETKSDLFSLFPVVLRGWGAAGHSFWQKTSLLVHVS